MSRGNTHRARGSCEAPDRQRDCRCRETFLDMQTELANLREENQWLRDSALFFAELAERLNTRLRDESPSVAAAASEHE